MNRILSALLLLSALLAMSSCGSINRYMRSADFDQKYEAAKQYYAKGRYDNAAILLGDVVNAMKGTVRGDEALFVFAMCKFMQHDMDAANKLFRRYYGNYPAGNHIEEAHFYAGRALYLNTPNVNLDQTDTYLAITEFQNFLELFPESKYAKQCQDHIFELQDKLVLKQYNAAKLYYDLRDYFNNCNFGGSNLEACIITAQNAIRDYPYSSLKEEFAILILRARFSLAERSVDEKAVERYSNTVDEYYGFVNEYPNSKYLKEAQRIYERSKDKVRRPVDADEAA